MTVPHLAAVELGPQDPPRPLLVLGPSLGTSAEALWAACASGLGAFNVVGWDLPGHGRSPAAAEPFTVAELAAGVLAVVDVLYPGSAFAYAGVSLGGAVGLQLLLDARPRVSSATLIATGARIGSAEGWQKRAALVRDSGTAALLGSTPARWFAPGFAERSPDVAAALLDALKAADAESYALASEALAEFDVRHRLGEVAAPVVAAAGRYDRVTTPVDLQVIAKGVDAGRLVVLDGCAHLPPAEVPSAVAQLVQGSLADGVRAAGTAVRRGVLGDAHVDRALAATTPFTHDFQDYLTRNAWGEIWTRPGLDLRSRSIVTLTALASLGHTEELALHVRGARRNGLTDDEIGEILLQTAVYCGVPAANSAFRVAQQVLHELEQEGW